MKLLIILAMIFGFISCKSIIEPEEKKENNAIVIFDTGQLILDKTVKEFYWGMADANEVIIYNDAWDYTGLTSERPIWIDSIKVELYWKENHISQQVVFWMAGPDVILEIDENQSYLSGIIKTNYSMYDLNFAVMFQDTVYGEVRVIGHLFANDSLLIN